MSHPLDAPDGVVDELLRLDDAGVATDALTEHALALGARPPSDGAGWLLVREYGPDGTDRGLVWDLDEELGPTAETAGPHPRRDSALDSAGTY